MIGSPYEKKQVEAVGEHYERLLERIYGEDEPAVQQVPEVATPEVDDKAQQDKYASHKKVKKGAPTADLYDLIGLGHLRWQATPDEIKAAFRRTAVEVHPDKAANKDDTLFKAVNAAYDTLGDPKKRRDYDSADPFDDALPDVESISKEDDFYKVMGAVFRNNAKWSKKTPVPDLGDASTPYTQIEIFYNFWIRFQTWREFAQLNEYEPEQAESREEKRWMERQNAKLQEGKRKEEASRLTKLVDLAYARDPRILRRKQDLAEEKNRAKNEKAEAQRKAREEAEQKKAEEEAERVRTEAAAKVVAAEAKVVRDKLKKVMRKKRQVLRQFGDANGIHFELIEQICERADDSRLDFLLAEVSNIEETKKRILDEVESYKSEEQKKREAEERGKIERAAEAKRAEEAKEVKWTPEELSLLSKGLAKFPGGAVNRWGAISQYMNHSKSEAEIIAKIKSVKNKDLKEKAPATRETDDAFQTFLRNKKDTPVLSPHSVRYEGSDSGPLNDGSFADDETEAAPAAAAAPVAAPATAASPAPAGASASSAAAPAAAATPVPVVETPKVEAPKVEAPKAEAQVEAAKVEAKVETPVVAAVEWSADQQTALEAALKQFPSTTENRWDVIAAAVPGRTKKECVERFKYLVAMVKGGKK